MSKKRSKQAVVSERWEKKEVIGRVVDEKFTRFLRVPSLEAKTIAQKEYMRQLRECQIVVASGHAGTGKSFVASYNAAQLLSLGKIDKIYVTRPYNHLGKDAGATPGTDFEKMLPFCRPMLDTIKKVLGEGKYNYCIDNGVIEVAPLEKIQGRSFDEPCVIICDETQNATKQQVLSLITRIGEGVEFLALCGDPRQSTSLGENALDWVVAFFVRNNIKNVGITLFSEQDCVRSGIVREILIAFEKEGGFYKNIKESNLR